MAEINDQLSDTSSDFNWPLDAALEGHEYDRVVFENVADQYVKGEDVTAFFTILQDIKVNANEDQIGLLRVGSANIQECLAYASIQFNPSTASAAVRHGTAVFPSLSIPVTDDEFYQFCYILNKTKNLGSSIPFQLNCAPDDIDLLSNVPVRKTKSDGLIALADPDNDEHVVIHTKRTLTEEKLRLENRHLLDINRRLESQKEECLTKLELYEAKQKEFNKLQNELQTLSAARKVAIDEISSRQQSETRLRTDYDACRLLCNQYQSEALEYADRCRTLEEAQTKILYDTNQVRNQLTVQSQFTKDQATQIVELERRLIQSDELAKTSNQRQVTFERQLRDYRLTVEKHEMSMQAQLEEFSRLKIQQEDQIGALETANELLKEEILSLKADNECLILKSNQDKDLVEDLQQQLDALKEQKRQENESVRNEFESLRSELNEKKSDTQAYTTLKTSFTEIEKRCVKYQKGEIEAKRQLTAHKEFINDLQRENQDLTERLSAGAEEYRNLARKYAVLEHSKEINQVQEKSAAAAVLPPPPPKIITTDKIDYNEDEEVLDSVLLNTYKNSQDKEDQQFGNSLAQHSLADLNAEVRQCPVCYWEFPDQMTVDGKREHIENHFQ